MWRCGKRRGFSPSRVRTGDLAVNSHTLYQLSYRRSTPAYPAHFQTHASMQTPTHTKQQPRRTHRITPHPTHIRPYELRPNHLKTPTTKHNTPNHTHTSLQSLRTQSNAIHTLHTNLSTTGSTDLHRQLFPISPWYSICSLAHFTLVASFHLHASLGVSLTYPQLGDRRARFAHCASSPALGDHFCLVCEVQLAQRHVQYVCTWTRGGRGESKRCMDCRLRVERCRCAV